MRQIWNLFKQNEKFVEQSYRNNSGEDGHLQLFSHDIVTQELQGFIGFMPDAFSNFRENINEECTVVILNRLNDVIYYCGISDLFTRRCNGVGEWSPP